VRRACRHRNRPHHRSGSSSDDRSITELSVQRLAELFCGAEPIRGTFRQRDLDRALQVFGHRVSNDPGAGHRLLKFLGEDGLRNRAGEWRIPGEHLEEDAPERVDIASRVQLIADGLFRAHVLGGAP
jgi:hypothetical protein